MAENQPQTIDANVHNALIQQLVQQRDDALAKCVNLGAENTMLKATIQQHNEKIEATAKEEAKAPKPAKASNTAN